MEPNGQSQQSVQNPLNVMQPGEQLVCEIKRHPFGIISTYVLAGFMVFAAALVAILVPHYISNVGSLKLILWGLFALIALVAAVVALVGAKVYWGNRWVVTSDSITQVSRTTLFDTQSSQLSMGNIEDVTAEQDGVLAHMFGFGSLRVETAGERSKFVFTYCPNPNYYAQLVLGARERFEQGRRNENPQRLYRDEGAYTSGYQQPTDQQPPDVPGPSIQT